MERIILTPDYVCDTDEAYIEDVLTRIMDAEPEGVAYTYNSAGDETSEMSLRRFVDPKSMTVRWARMISADECEIRDYASKREALSFWRKFVKECKAEGIVWS